MSCLKWMNISHSLAVTTYVAYYTELFDISIVWFILLRENITFYTPLTRSAVTFT